ncbi:MAG: methyltransferase domain-containing protein [Dehalococcoidia bacterium]|nr:methyltransferase domain-containing protein [Dehalococcoidia bacterium]
MTYESIIAELRQAYDKDAPRRDTAEIEPWKVEERDRFLALMRAEGSETLLEVGSGPGVHGRFFQDEGLNVTCTDLSPEHVRLCREKGLKAEVMDFLSLDFGSRTFDAVFALNCLLHVPHADFVAALMKIHSVIKPGGLFYLGQYGGINSEAVSASDSYEPKRFFAFFTDDELCRQAAEVFELVDFRVIDLEGERPGFHFQAMTLRADGLV